MTMMDLLVKAARSADDDGLGTDIGPYRMEEMVRAILAELPLMATSTASVRDLVEAILTEVNPAEGRHSYAVANEIAFLQAQISQVKGFLSRPKEQDPIGNIQWTQLLKEYEGKLADLEGRQSTSPTHPFPSPEWTTEGKAIQDEIKALQKENRAMLRRMRGNEGTGIGE